MASPLRQQGERSSLSHLFTQNIRRVALSKRTRRLHTLCALCNLLVPNRRKLFRRYQLTFTISILLLLLSAYLAQHAESRKQGIKPPSLEVYTFQRRQEFCEIVDQFLLRLAIKAGHENRIISGDCACYGRHMADIYISSEAASIAGARMKHKQGARLSHFSQT